MNVLQKARQATDRLGSETTYDAIVRVIKEYKGRDKIGFALGFTSYISDRHIRMSEDDQLKFYSLNLQIRDLWKETR